MSSPSIGHPDVIYRFDLIARTGSGLSELRTPTLNERGEVAFFAIESSAGVPDLEAIYRGRAGQAPTRLAREGDQPDLNNPAVFASFGQRPSISDSGHVTFLATFDNGGNAILRSGNNAGIVSVIADGPPPNPFSALSGDPIGKGDDFIAFNGTRQAAGDPSRLSVLFIPGDGSLPRVTVAETNAVIGGFTLTSRRFTGFDTANNGLIVDSIGPTVAYSSLFRDAAGDSFTGLFVEANTPLNMPLPPLNLVHQAPLGTDDGNYHPSLSKLGALAFLVTPRGTGLGQEIRGYGDNLFLNTFAPERSEFTVLGPPLINDQNVLAFTGKHVLAGDGIYTASSSHGLNPDSTRVVAVGDFLLFDGRTDRVDDVFLGGFNNRGQIAFLATVGDARDQEIIVLATPVSVPEPATAALLAVGLGIVSVAATSRRRGARIG